VRNPAPTPKPAPPAAALARCTSIKVSSPFHAPALIAAVVAWLSSINAPPAAVEAPLASQRP
jgi:hypothetical protein